MNVIFRPHNRERRGETKYADRGRDWSEVCINPVIPKMSNSNYKTREGHGIDFPSDTSEETNPANTWISDFWPSEL